LLVLGAKNRTELNLRTLPSSVEEIAGDDDDDEEEDDNGEDDDGSR
jgi:hypothetical protein